MGYLQGRRCYLSGPIEHDTPVNWRDKPKSFLREHLGMEVFDPNDDPKQKLTDELYAARRNNDYDTIARIAHGFVRKDLTEVVHADVVVAYLPNVRTCGTHHEIIQASDLKKPTILVCPDGKSQVPLWFYGFIHHSMFFGSWDDAFNYLHEVDYGGHDYNKKWHYILRKL